MKTRIILGTILALTFTTMASADGFGSSCVAAPPELSEAAKKCYAEECSDHLHNLADCGTDPLCTALENLRYALAVGLCASLENTAETSSDLVIWLNKDGQWAVAWPGDEIDFGALRYDFKI